MQEYNLTVYDTKEPEKVLRELLSWLGLDWEPKLLNHQVEDSYRASTMFHIWSVYMLVTQMMMMVRKWWEMLRPARWKQQRTRLFGRSTGRCHHCMNLNTILSISLIKRGSWEMAWRNPRRGEIFLILFDILQTVSHLLCDLLLTKYHIFKQV